MENQIFRESQNGFSFMSWEQNPKKRNINNIVKFNVNKDTLVNVGDVIYGETNLPFRPEYTITEVIEERPSKMNGKKYVTVRTEWQNINVTNN